MNTEHLNNLTDDELIRLLQSDGSTTDPVIGTLVDRLGLQIDAYKGLRAVAQGFLTKASVLLEDINDEF